MAEQQYDPDIITLSDDEGTEYTFEVLDAIETDEGRYLALMPQYDSPDEMLEDSGELVILKVFEDENDTYYEEIDDDEEYETVAEAFIDRLRDLFEVDEQDGE